MCPRGEIGRHKGLKSLGINKLHCLRQSQVVSGSLKTLSIPTFLFNPSINIRNYGKFICAN